MCRLLPLLLMLFYCININAQLSIVKKGELDHTTFYASLANETKDTLYVFDSYFQGKKRIDSPVFYHFNKKKNTCTITFLPLVPYLTVSTKSDHIILGPNSYVNYGQYQYHFAKVSPSDTITIYLNPYGADFPCCKEVNLRKYTKFDKKIKFKITELPYSYKLNCQIAVYKDISYLLSDEYFYNREIEFNNQALSYEFITIPFGRRTIIH